MQNLRKVLRRLIVETDVFASKKSKWGPRQALGQIRLPLPLPSLCLTLPLPLPCLGRGSASYQGSEGVIFGPETLSFHTIFHKTAVVFPGLFEKMEFNVRGWPRPRWKQLKSGHEKWW